MTMRKLRARRDAVDPKEVIGEFAAWATRVAHGKPVVFLANNAPFDWMFIAWYFEEYGVKNPFGHSALDMKAYFMGLTKCRWKDATLANMAEYADTRFTKLPHRAFLDALWQKKIFERVQNTLMESV